MTIDDLDVLLQEGEGIMVEFKERLSTSFARELVAFANTEGGRILLGVRDDGTIKGISDSNELRARIQSIAHRIAFIEKAGTGIRRMREGSRELGYPEPVFVASGFFNAIFYPLADRGAASTLQVTPQVTPQVLTLLGVAMREASAADLQAALHLKDRVHFLKKYLEPTLEKGLVERMIPDKPRSPKQRYRTTAAGRSVLEHYEEEPHQ